MIRIAGTLTAAMAVIALLSGCGSDEREGADLPRLLIATGKQAVASRRAGIPPPVEVTPKMLAETQVAALQVNPERSGGSDFLRRAATRRDSYPGVVEIWKSSDSAQVFLRSGVVVATRGVGGDIIAADATMTVAALRNLAGNAGLRRYELSDGDVTTTTVQFRCQVELMGSEEITVVNQVFETVHLRESCTGDPAPAAGFTNDYWVQKGTDVVRKSRQWMGPRSGYFEMILLKE